MSGLTVRDPWAPMAAPAAKESRFLRDMDVHTVLIATPRGVPLDSVLDALSDARDDSAGDVVEFAVLSGTKTVGGDEASALFDSEDVPVAAWAARVREDQPVGWMRRAPRPAESAYHWRIPQPGGDAVAVRVYKDRSAPGALRSYSVASPGAINSLSNILRSFRQCVWSAQPIYLPETG